MSIANYNSSRLLERVCDADKFVWNKKKTSAHAFIRNNDDAIYRKKRLICQAALYNEWYICKNSSYFSRDVVQGTEGQGHDSAGQTNDVVRHREVWRWQVDEQRLRVQLDHLVEVEHGPV